MSLLGIRRELAGRVELANCGQDQRLLMGFHAALSHERREKLVSEFIVLVGHPLEVHLAPMKAGDRTVDVVETQLDERYESSG